MKANDVFNWCSYICKCVYSCKCSCICSYKLAIVIVVVVFFTGTNPIYVV